MSLNFYRVIIASAWTMIAGLIGVPILGVTLIRIFEDEGSSALAAFAIAIIIGAIGYFLTMNFIKRWSV